jgi:hypothetical protein
LVHSIKMSFFNYLFRAASNRQNITGQLERYKIGMKICTRSLLYYFHLISKAAD